MSKPKQSFEDWRRKLLLLQGGMHYQEVPTTLSKEARASISKSEARITTAKFPGEYHFEGYQYLGPGTQYLKRQKLGIEPINMLDRIAMYHDKGYEVSSSNRMGIARAMERGFYDLSSGTMMIGAAVNPMSDAPLGLSLLSGTALLAQGLLRIHPVTLVPMGIVDLLFY